MTQYTDNEIISKLLNACNNKDLLMYDFIESLLGDKEGWVQTQRIVKFIKDNKLADIVKNEVIVANPTTKKINADGGYLAHIDRGIAKQADNDKIDKAKNDLILIDLTIAKWKKKTFWPVFIGGIIGGIMGAISLSGQLGLLDLPQIEKHKPTSKGNIDSVSIHHPQDSLIRHISK